MRKLLKKLILFSIPFIVYFIIVICVDPYGFYKANTFVDTEVKENISKKIEPHLYKMIAFENNPKPNVLLGDSRTNRFYENIIKHKDNWSSLGYGAGSLNEVLATFDWIKAKEYKLDTLLIGLNFNLYNKYNKRTWVEETVERKNNVFSYVFSSYAAKSTFLIFKNLVFGEEIVIGKPKMSRDLFWKNSIKNYGKKFYAKYGYPDNYLKRLQLVSNYCNDNDIKLIFWIPPCSEELNLVVKDYNLMDERERFYDDLSNLGDLYNFNLDKNITLNKDNFTDPAHFNFETGEYIYNRIFKK